MLQAAVSLAFNGWQPWLHQKLLCTLCLLGHDLVLISSCRKVKASACPFAKCLWQCTLLAQLQCFDRTPDSIIAFPVLVWLSSNMPTPEPALSALCSCTAVQNGSQYLFLIPIGMTVVIVAVALGIWVRVSLPSYVSRWNRKRGPPEPGKQVTLVLTDVEGSTELWEWQHEVIGPRLYE